MFSIRPLRAGLFTWLWLACGIAMAGPSAAPGPAWPAPPAEPCIIYVRQFTEPRDIGSKAPFFTRLANSITGVKTSDKQLNHPFGLSLDDDGNLTVTDTGVNAVHFLDLNHKKWQSWQAAGNHRFLSPVAAVHHDQTFYVADTGWGGVMAFDMKGRLQFEMTNELARPAGLALLGDRLYVVDSERHQVVVCGLRGEFISKFGQRGKDPGEFNFPTHIAVDHHQQVYVTDSLNGRIQEFTAEGKFIRMFGSPGDAPGHFSRPKGVAVDQAGHVYVVDAMFGNVQIFNAEGRLLLDFGADGNAAGQFSLPNGIAINAHNEIFVADVYNHRLQMFRYTGRE